MMYFLAGMAFWRWSCYHYKYKVESIRPESVINEESLVSYEALSIMNLL
jgi:hypothetical protein